MNKVYFFLLDILEFFGKIEMKIKHLLNRNLYKSLSENNIPPNTFYCYSGCRYNLNICPFMDYSIIAGSKYCHFIEGGIYDPLLYDDCKICGINELDEE